MLEAYRDWFRETGVSYPDAAERTALTEYLTLLLSWNKRMNLTADGLHDTLVRRHLLDSLTATLLPEMKCNEVVDIGSGTGFPAIPLAICIPSTTFLLVEKVHRKCAFLKMVARKLRLGNVQVTETDLETWRPREKWPQVAITRAVRVDAHLLEQLDEKGVLTLVYFSSNESPESRLSYRLPCEERDRFLDVISIEH